MVDVKMYPMPDTGYIFGNRDHNNDWFSIFIAIGHNIFCVVLVIYYLVNYHISVEDQAFGLICNICVKNLHRFLGQEHRYCVHFELQQIVVITVIYGNNGNIYCVNGNTCIQVLKGYN